MAQIIDFKVGPVNTRAAIGIPSGNGPFPGLVLTFHRYGIDSFTHWLVDDLVSKGFVVIAPDHFHVIPPDKGPDDRKDYLTDEQMVEDLKAATAWLDRQDKVLKGKKYGLFGHCMGGRTTWVGLESIPDLWACGCVWYGGGALKPLGKRWPAPVERLADIKAPVMGFFGNDDKNPSPADIDKFDEGLTKLGKWHEFHRYDGTAHGFMNQESKKSYREKAATDSWARGVAFMRKSIVG